MPNLTKIIKTVHGLLGEIQEIEKCRGCECYLNVLGAVQGDLGDFRVSKDEPACVDIQRWWEEGNAKRHGCLGCKLCHPVRPYNEFRESLTKAKELLREPLETKLIATPCSCGGTCLTKPEYQFESTTASKRMIKSPPSLGTADK